MIYADTILTIALIILGNFAVFALGIVWGTHSVKRKYEVKKDGVGDNKQDILDGILNSN